MRRKIKFAVVALLLALAVGIGYKVVADYCYTSGIKGSIVTFMSPKDYNFNIGTVFNDEYTKANEANGNSFSVTDTSILSWYLPSGTWGLQASFMNETFFKQYFSSLTVTATFIDVHGHTIGTMNLGYTTLGDLPNPCPQFDASGVNSGHVSIIISGTVNPSLVAGEVDIGCTTIVEWCPQ